VLNLNMYVAYLLQHNTRTFRFLHL